MTTKTVAPPPEHLGEAGQKLWVAVLAEFDLPDAAGRELLAVACAALDRIRQAQEAITKHGATIPDRYGGVRLNPACALEKDSRAGFIAALKTLGITSPPEGTP